MPASMPEKQSQEIFATRKWTRIASPNYLPCHPSSSGIKNQEEEKVPRLFPSQVPVLFFLTEFRTF